VAARDVGVRVIGPCKSACTVLLAHIPRSKICVMPAASFGFHQALRLMTTLLWNGYPSDVKAWITRHGGLPGRPSCSSYVGIVRAPAAQLSWLMKISRRKFLGTRLGQ
jgi:hypothetical protein